ncbi:MAG: queuosine precursor transporter [Elusimicrobia bacterium]|nr:queuosine precursor transporter [Elusimicrobiota bacterium]
MNERRYSVWFVLITALFVTSLIVSNITAVKIISVGGFYMTAANIVFPVSYILGDVLTEVYGYSRSRLVIWTGFACNLMAVLVIYGAKLMPPAPFWQGQGAYQEILGAAPRILTASFLAYLAGEFTNSFTLAKMKILTRGRVLWARTIGSTLAGQAVDTVIFVSVAFAGTMPLKAAVILACNEWLFKVSYEALATPITYKAVGFLKRAEGIDYYDHQTNFNPFKIT